MLQEESTTDMATTQSKFGRRFDEEFKREVVARASRPGATNAQVGRDLGVSPWNVSRWRRQYAHNDGSGQGTLPPRATTAAAPGASVQELERRIRSLERENADLREQRTILKKSRRPLLRTCAMKFGVIRELAGEHAVRKRCRTLGVARSAYYAAQKKEQRPRAKENARLGARAREPFEASGRTYGSPRLKVALCRAGEPCGRHRVARRMRQAGTARQAQASLSAPLPADSRHLCPNASNHLAARVDPPTRVNEVWQADLTYIATQEGWLYVAGVLDACSRKIVGWAAADTMPTALIARAFARAVQAERPAPGLLHHSDRGSQDRR